METYKVENDHLMIEVLDYGATLTSLYVKKYETDVVLGFYNVEKYQNEGKYIGQTIGRVANRIALGEFVLDDVKYNIKPNNGPNLLHGGENGLDNKIFKIIKENNQISCYYTMEDMEDGFPGKIDIIVKYTLNDNALEISYEAKSDKNTLCSLTNHSFFNLLGQGSIEDHELMVNADRVGTIDEDGLTLNETFSVENTPFNFLDLKEIKQTLVSNHPQILLGKGLDHNFCLNSTGFKHKATLKINDRKMKVYTDLVNMHVYSGNYLDNQLGKNNIVYSPRSGICFETQEYPNSINLTDHDKPILLANKKYTKRTKFVFE